MLVVIEEAHEFLSEERVAETRVLFAQVAKILGFGVASTRLNVLRLGIPLTSEKYRLSHGSRFAEPLDLRSCRPS